MKFKAELAADTEVIFDDPEKAKAEFIDGDWNTAFWDIEDMESLARDLIFAIHQQPERHVYDEKTNKGHYEKTPEGFGKYIKHGNSWVMDNEHTGIITVTIDDLEVQCVHEIPG